MFMSYFAVKSLKIYATPNVAKYSYIIKLLNNKAVTNEYLLCKCEFSAIITTHLYNA